MGQLTQEADSRLQSPAQLPEQIQADLELLESRIGQPGQDRLLGRSRGNSTEAIRAAQRISNYIRSGGDTYEYSAHDNSGMLVADGDFGPRTRASIAGLQQHLGVSVDGVIGQETLGAMRTALGQTTPGSSPSQTPRGVEEPGSAALSQLETVPSELATSRTGEPTYRALGTYQGSVGVMQGTPTHETVTELDLNRNEQARLRAQFTEQLSNLTETRAGVSPVRVGESAMIVDYERGSGSVAYIVERTESGFEFTHSMQVSGSRVGAGTTPDSNRTPLGSFNMVAGSTVLVDEGAGIIGGSESRRGITDPDDVRIMTTGYSTMHGLDPDNANSAARSILLHGTPWEGNRYGPNGSFDRSTGCINLSNRDMHIMGQIMEAQFASQQARGLNSSFRMEVV